MVHNYVLLLRVVFSFDFTTMSRRGEYSSKYGYNKSTISFSCGGISMVDATHGTLSVSDIDGAQPRKYTSERFEPSLAVSCPVDQQFLPTRDRHIQRNPLDPVYDIPELEDVQENILRPRAPSEVPKFLRDTMDLSDIDGQSFLLCQLTFLSVCTA